MPRKRKHGGARPGAGRQPIGGVRRSEVRTVKLTPDEAAAQDAVADGPWATWAHRTLVAAATPGHEDLITPEERDSLLGNGE